MKHIIFLSVVLFFFSCGRPRVDSHRSNKVDLPELPSLNSLSELEGKSFNGNLIFFDNNIDQESLDLLSNASSNDRIIEAKIAANLNSELLPLRTELNELILENNREFSQLIKVYSNRPNLASELNLWLKSNIKNSSDLFSDNLELIYSRYCDAKVWQFAAHKNLATKNFEHLPIPSSACLEYYIKNNILDSKSPECKNDGSEKNYFDCFWRQGVLNTCLLYTSPSPRDRG